MTAVDRYCEVIYELDEDDIEALQVRIAERLGVSRPAVSEMTSRLVADGLVEAGGGRLVLTVSGRETAESAVRRHRLAERFLVDVLGLGWAEAHEAAGRWQTVIDDRTEPALVQLLGQPETCPHGNPIPGLSVRPAGVSPSAVGDLRPLAAVGEGQVAVVARVTERLENEPGMLATLERAGLLPGTTAEVLSVSADGSMAVRGSATVIALSPTTASAILVRPA